jgi:hypothetical protein
VRAHKNAQRSVNANLQKVKEDVQQNKANRNGVIFAARNVNLTNRMAQIQNAPKGASVKSPKP